MIKTFHLEKSYEMSIRGAVVSSQRRNRAHYDPKGGAGGKGYFGGHSNLYSDEEH